MKIYLELKNKNLNDNYIYNYIIDTYNRYLLYLIPPEAEKADFSRFMYT